eukprot:ctg_1127.g228
MASTAMRQWCAAAGDARLAVRHGRQRGGLSFGGRSADGCRREKRESGVNNTPVSSVALRDVVAVVSGGTALASARQRPGVVTAASDVRSGQRVERRSDRSSAGHRASISAGVCSPGAAGVFQPATAIAFAASAAGTSATDHAVRVRTRARWRRIRPGDRLPGMRSTTGVHRRSGWPAPTHPRRRAAVVGGGGAR